MSYEIIYDKQFIKVKDRFIPMVLGGSSNCYDMDNKRSRSWFGFIGANHLLVSEQELLSHVEDTRKRMLAYSDDYEDSRFGYFAGLHIKGNKETTFGNYMGIVKTGIKKAITFEQLKEYFGCGVRVYTYMYDNERYKELGIEKLDKTVYSEDEFLELLNTVDDYTRKTVTVYVTFSHQISEREMSSFRKRKFPKTKKTKQKITVDKYYGIQMVGYGMFRKLTRSNTYYSTWGHFKMFADENSAVRYLNNLEKKRPSYEFKIKEFMGPKELYV